MKFLRKTVIGISAIAFTALTLGTATYAWFPINSQAKIDTTELSVTGGLGFMVSVDGVNYKNELSRDDITNALLASYRPSAYVIGYDSGTGESVLCQPKTVEVLDENGVATGETKVVADLDNRISEADKANALKGIELMPLTSRDGINFDDLYNSSASVTSGRFMEFSVYFKTSSSTGKYEKSNKFYSDKSYYEQVIVDGKETYVYKENVTTENYKDYYIFNGSKYDIYLNGETQYSDAKPGQDPIEISPTKFRSVKTKVDLSADMNATIYDVDTGLRTVTQLKKSSHDSIDVYSSNAIRLSITDTTAYKSSPGDYTANIYELNDSKYGKSNLGSYATTYSETTVDAYVAEFTAAKLAEDPEFDFESYKADLTAKYGEEYCKNIGLVYSSDLAKDYYYENNAMYTYYTNLKQTATLTNKLKAYNYFPTTIKDLTSKDANGDYIYNKKITTLSSGEDGKLITFRIWLEGWDADCFDGLKDSITASLSFSSKRIY